MDSVEKNINGKRNEVLIVMAASTFFERVGCNTTDIDGISDLLFQMH